MRKNQNLGYTLIELMIVLVIISIIAVWGGTQYLRYSRKAKLAAAKSALIEDTDYLENFFSKHYSYNTRDEDSGNCQWPQLPKTQTPGFAISFGEADPECRAQHYILYAKPDENYKNQEKHYLRTDEEKNITLCVDTSGGDKKEDNVAQCVVY